MALVLAATQAQHRRHGRGAVVDAAANDGRLLARRRHCAGQRGPARLHTARQRAPTQHFQSDHRRRLPRQPDHGPRRPATVRHSCAAGRVALGRLGTLPRLECARQRAQLGAHRPLASTRVGPFLVRLHAQFVQDIVGAATSVRHVWSHLDRAACGLRSGRLATLVGSLLRRDALHAAELRVSAGALLRSIRVRDDHAERHSGVHGECALRHESSQAEDAPDASHTAPRGRLGRR